MSIFSRVKKAKKAAEEYKKAVIQTEEAKPPPATYKHVVSHAAQDALAATPTRWSPEESRARIATARKTRSEMVVSAPATANHSRANSERNSPSGPVLRSKSDMSIGSVMHNPKL
ncbi:hypothetical protein BDV96DRAFT_310809 [Lophiotrema nucula]|uniref:Uncharacterized protein n=1 Tax=Lophiotrema nucula TaxID=690887 RepID=A0A6A5YI54_9PLEO|nr:hypothetical protein BDV96DRAFT_310809 [Lophiotrema nucula]